MEWTGPPPAQAVQASPVHDVQVLLHCLVSTLTLANASYEAREANSPSEICLIVYTGGYSARPVFASLSLGYAIVSL